MTTHETVGHMLCPVCERPHDPYKHCPAPEWLIEGRRATPLRSGFPARCDDPACARDDACKTWRTGSAPRLAANSAERKATPITTGVLDYFPLAMAAIARLSKRGNDKHNPGEPLHWAREKSTDHADCVARHLIERGTVEPESGEMHEACLAWRALALLQLAEEKRLAIQRSGV